MKQNKRVLSVTDDLEDLANGACILASGGGGSISMARPIIDKLRDNGIDEVELFDPCDLTEKDWVIVMAAAGSPASTAVGETVPALIDAAVQAFDEAERDLLEHGERSFTHTSAIETGVGTTRIPIAVAAAKGIPVLDGAGAPRSVPALTMCTYADLNPSPVKVVSPGNGTEERKVVSFTVKDTETAEQPMMAIVSTPDFSRLGGLAFWPMNGKTAGEKTTLNPGR